MPMLCSVSSTAAGAMLERIHAATERDKHLPCVTTYELHVTSVSGELLLLQEPELENTPTLTNTQLARAASSRLQRADSSSSASSHHAE